MKLIDAKKKLTSKSIDDFVDGQMYDTVVNMLSEKTDAMFTSDIQHLQELFMNKDAEAVFTDDNDVITIISEDTALQFLGLDFKYFITPVRGVKYKRLEKLFNINIEKSNTDKMNNISSKKSAVTADKSADDKKSTLSIECGTFDENDNLISSEIISGTKKDLISQLNKYYSLTLLRSHFKHVVKFRFNSDEEWSTLEDLEHKGVFII